MVSNKLGICTVSLGCRFHHELEEKLQKAAAAGHQAIDLFEDDWLYYLSKQPGVDPENPWSPIEAHLAPARKIGNLIAELGMEVVCLQPLINVEGLIIPEERAWAEHYVKSVFPFMRAFRTTTVFITTNRRVDRNVSGDMDVIAKDLANFADLAAEYAKADGGPMLVVGYEALSWGSKINRWKDSWTAVNLADRPNLKIVFDSFNILAVEYADSYNPSGTGRVHDDPKVALDMVRSSMAELARTVPGDKICVVQLGDGELMDPKAWLKPVDPMVPPILPWSRGHRLYPMEQDRGGYMPVTEVLAAILATGYTGPLTLEVFNDSLLVPGDDVIVSHAERGIVGLRKLVAAAQGM